MKKTYQKPELSIVQIKTQPLAGSVTSTGISGTPAGQPARSKGAGDFKWRDEGE